MQTKKEFVIKHHSFWAKNLRKSRKFHTTAGCDGWDIIVLSVGAALCSCKQQQQGDLLSVMEQV